MKVKILTLAAGLKEILGLKLNAIGLTVEAVDYDQPLLPQLVDADVLVNGLGKIDKMIIDASPKLKMIHQIGIGVDNVDVNYCTSKSIYVANIPKNNAVAVSEFTLFLMIYLAKNMKSAGTSLMKRRVLSVMGSELNGKTLLIVGLGYTGTEVAKRAKSFGMHVTAVTKTPTKQTDKKYLDKLVGIENFHELLREADYVSLHIPLTEETKNMIDTKELNVMKKSAFLINVARAAVVNKDALFSALTNGTMYGAAFDVFWEEPADPNDKILKLDNFILTPHIAGWSAESVDEVTKTIATNIDMISQGKTPPSVVNSI